MRVKVLIQLIKKEIAKIVIVFKNSNNVQLSAHNSNASNDKFT